ncbi:MAG: hypothetical protein ACI9A2_004216, partial [Halioglobus sp.]
MCVLALLAAMPTSRKFGMNTSAKCLGIFFQEVD